jgi:hypothetical protein
MDLLANVTGKEISVIKDPFLKDCVTDISIRYSTSFNRCEWSGNVEFKNGNTEGKQSIPRCATIEEAITNLKIILDTIKSKSNNP